jgi:antitoxin component YwqK of YwqJK toxin-antitoxin module
VRGKIHGPSKQWDLDGNLLSNFTYNLSKAEGYTYVYRNGKMISRDYYEEGEEQQDFREYYPNGSVFRIIPYVDDQREGEYPYFSPDSVKLFSYNYESNQITSVNIRNKQGKIEKVPASNPTGTVLTSYYPNETVAAIIPLVKGYMEGTLTLYYPNGNKLRERSFKSDYLEGLSTDYYANGKVKEIIRFVNNDKTGEYVSYSEAGLKIEEGEFTSDNRVGTWTYYDAAGKPKYKVSYDNDKVYEVK